MNFPAERFERFGLCEALRRRLEETGHELPSHIQSACIPGLLAGRDLLAQACAGSGRTLAFVLPLLQILELGRHRPQALVLTASDRVTLRVAETLQSMARHLTGFRVLPVNHQSAAIQARQMRRGVHVVVGTPRRVLHHADEHGLDLGEVTRIVFDEADEMLDEGFGGDIDRLLRASPALRQTAVFAATVSHELARMAGAFQRDALRVKGVEPSPAAAGVRQRYWRVDDHSKLGAMTRVIEIEPDFDAALVFVHEPRCAIELAEKLRAHGYAAAALESAARRRKRQAQLAGFGRGDIDLLVATDRTARGLHLERMTHVIGYDLPCDAEAHVARIALAGGARGRASAVLLVTPDETALLRELERATGQPVRELELPERVR